MKQCSTCHDDVIKWKHFPRDWPFVRGIHRSTQRPVTRSFDVYFDLRLIKRLSKQCWGWWFETLSCPLWRHRNVVCRRNDKNTTRRQIMDRILYICVPSLPTDRCQNQFLNVLKRKYSPRNRYPAAGAWWRHDMETHSALPSFLGKSSVLSQSASNEELWWLRCCQPERSTKKYKTNKWMNEYMNEYE